MRSRRWSRVGDACGAPAQDGADHLGAQCDKDEDRDGALRAEALPGVDEVTEVADRPLVLLHHELDQLLKHAGDDDRDRAREDRAAHDRWTGTQGRAEQAGNRATADQDGDPGGKAELQRQHVEQVGRQCDEDRMQRNDRHHHREHRDRRARRGAGEQSRKRTPRHRAGTAGDQQQRRLPEAQHIDDDPALVHCKQHADRRQVHRAGAEREADRARRERIMRASSPCARPAVPADGRSAP